MSPSGKSPFDSGRPRTHTLSSGPAEVSSPALEPSVFPGGIGSGVGRAKSTLRTLEYSPDYIVSSWRWVMFLAWRAAQTAAGIHASLKFMARLASSWPDGIVLVILVPSLAVVGPPTEEARTAMTNAARHPPAHLKGIGMIGANSGFIASAVRSIITARASLVRSAIPYKMFSSTDEAAPWVARCVGSKEDISSDFLAAAESAYWHEIGKLGE